MARGLQSLHILVKDNVEGVKGMKTPIRLLDIVKILL